MNPHGDEQTLILLYNKISVLAGRQLSNILCFGERVPGKNT
jgi:hypothetical protein